MGEPKEEAVSTLRLMNDVDQDTIENGISNREYREEYIEWRFEKGEESGLIGFHEGTVSHLYLDFNERIRLGNIVRQIGEPDFIKITRYRTIGEYVSVVFVYNDGACIRYDRSSLLKFDYINITPRLKIDAIYYYDLRLLDPDEFYLEGAIDLYSPFSITYEWQGYGKYKMLEID